MSAWMLVWAVVSGCTALVHSFGGLVACRFFLGITEASKSNLLWNLNGRLTHIKGALLPWCDLHAFDILHSER